MLRKPGQGARKPFRSGQRLRPDTVNALLDEVVQNIKGGKNVVVERVGSSVVISTSSTYGQLSKSRWL